MTVLVTVGSTQFDKLLDSVHNKEIHEKLYSFGYHSLVYQYGSGTCPPELFKSPLKIQKFEYSNEFSKILTTADLVIGHCGAGTILESLTPPLERKLICVINTNLMDNHQLELATSLNHRGYCLATYPQHLKDLIFNGKSHDPFIHHGGSTNPIDIQVDSSKVFKPFTRGDSKLLNNFLIEIMKK